MDLSSLSPQGQVRPASEIVARPPELFPSATPYQIRELPHEPTMIAAVEALPEFEFPLETDFQNRLLPEEESENDSPPVKEVAAKSPPKQKSSTARLPQAKAKPKPAPRPTFVQATVRSRGKASFPESARRRGQQGTAHVRVDVSPAGRVTGSRVSRSSGHATLDKAALKAAAKWRFNPATRGGQATSSQLIIPISFRLN